jgi:hypothetical protein
MAPILESDEVCCMGLYADEVSDHSCRLMVQLQKPVYLRSAPPGGA